MSPQNRNLIEEALRILILLGLPRAQQNERSALSLLAILNLTPEKSWSKAEDPLMGITPIMDWVRNHYDKDYAPNTRETVRRQTMHQFMDAGIVIYNPDDPQRPVNSPRAVYQIESQTLKLLRSFNSDEWEENLKEYLNNHQTLTAKYAKERDLQRIPVKILEGEEITLSPGEHSELIRDIVENFAPYFAPGSKLIYVGDTGDKWGYFDTVLLKELGVSVDSHGMMPDVMLYYEEKNWLIVAESVTSHGPVDSKRHNELKKMLSDSKAELVFVTAFPNRLVMGRYLSEISWETEVWLADAPTHLIHFNGSKFLGPY